MYISYEATEEAASKFLSEYNSKRTIPVPIERIVELNLEISMVPIKGLLSSKGIDAFLSRNFEDMYIDEDHYMSQTNRSRFTLAHEIGHYVLHKDVVASVKTLDSWRSFILGEETGRAIYEVHSDNFAGCLLMPRPEIEKEYKNQREMAATRFEKAGVDEPDQKTLISFIANEVARKFDVSAKAAEIRLSKIFLQGL